MNSFQKRNFRDKNTRRAARVPWHSRRVLVAMTAATQPPSAVAELGLMGVVGTSAVLARQVSAKAFVERGKRVTNARRAFGGGDGGAKAEAARKEALASARESSSAAARARRLLDYSPGSSTPDGTGRAVGSDATTPLTSPKKQETKVDAKDATASGGKDTASTEPATKPARRRSTTSTGVFSPPRSPKSPLMSPGMKSPTKSDDAPEKSPGSVSPAAALAATAAAARVRVAAAAANAAASPHPDAQADAAAREARANAAAAAAAARVRKSREAQFGASSPADVPSLAAAASAILEETRRARDAAASEAARRVQRAREQEVASRAARRAAEAEKQNRGRASREAASHAKERRRREIYALNALLAASERGAAGAPAEIGGSNAVPNHLRV